MLFSDFPHIYQKEKSLLIQMVNRRRLPTVLSLIAPLGGGDLALTHGLIAYLHCTKRTGTSSCGACTNCLQTKKWAHPHLHFLVPAPSPSIWPKKSLAEVLKKWRLEMESNPYLSLNHWKNSWGTQGKQFYISVEQIRVLKEKLTTKVSHGRPRTILIWSPETLHTNAANALLKMLEEPIANHYFFLVTNQPASVLSTLRSRSSSLYVRAPRLPELIDYCKSVYPIAKESDLTQLILSSKRALERIHHALSNSTKTAPTAINQQLPLFKNWLRACYAKDWISLAAQADWFHGESTVVQENWLNDGLDLMKNGLMGRWSADFLAGMAPDDKLFVDRLTKTISVDKQKELLYLLKEWKRRLSRHLYGKLAFMNHSLDLVEIFHKQTIPS